MDDGYGWREEIFVYGDIAGDEMMIVDEFKKFVKSEVFHLTDFVICIENILLKLHREL